MAEGLRFRSLDSRIYECKLQNENKIFIQVRSELSYNLKGSQKMGSGQNSLKISAPLHLIEIYQMRTSISLDRTFNSVYKITDVPLKQVPFYYRCSYPNVLSYSFHDRQGRKKYKTLEEKCVLFHRYRDLKLDLWDTSCDWSVQALLLLKSQIRIADTAKKKSFQSFGPLDFISPKFL